MTTYSEDDRLAAVAYALLELKFGEMLDLGTTLSDIATSTESFDVDDRNSFALLLQSWAENYDRGES